MSSTLQEDLTTESDKSNNDECVRQIHLSRHYISVLGSHLALGANTYPWPSSVRSAESCHSAFEAEFMEETRR